MKFEIVDREGFIPELKYGEQGRELACFVPDFIEWQQLHYSSGVGTVLIDGHEWEFSHAGEGISVELQRGVVTIDEASRFVHAVKDKVFGEKTREVQILLIGSNIHSSV